MSIRTWGSCPTCAGLVPVAENWDQVNHPACKRDTRSQLAEDYRTAVERGFTAEADRLDAVLTALHRDDLNRSLRKTALWYAHRGWPVFPLRPGDKRPLTEHGFQDASTNPQVVDTWWTTHPEANIGIATGVMFDVIDVDWLNKNGQATGAAESWPGLRDSGVLPDLHGVALTARGGLHLFIKPQGWANAWLALPGIDVRGIGGYIVAPPSRQPNGRHWAWVVRPSPRITGLPDFPNGPPPDRPTPPEPEQGELFDVGGDQPPAAAPATRAARNGGPAGSGIRGRWLASGMSIDQPWAPVHPWQTWGVRRAAA
jgi:hypothetical protein